MKDADGDVLGVVQRSLRRATPELRTQVMECVVGEMIDHGDWASLMFWEGELENAVAEYLRMLNRTEQAVCGCCFNNLGKGLQERLKGRVVVEEARRQG
jgi:hypothetical protein